MYAVLASVTPEGGGCNGIDLGTAKVHIPFCADLVLRTSLDFMNSSIFQSTFGVLDSYTGQGVAKLDVTGAVLPPSAIGLEIYFFFLTKPSAGGWDKAWQATSIEIVP